LPRHGAIARLNAGAAQSFCAANGGDCGDGATTAEQVPFPDPQTSLTVRELDDDDHPQTAPIRLTQNYDAHPRELWGLLA
jgi:hypothetical protein